MERRALGKFACGAMIACASALNSLSRVGAAELSPADSIDAAEAPAPMAQGDVRAGGVLQESFQYYRPGYGGLHPAGRHAPRPSIAPPGGWYGYGFPVQTYRWGWFGAGRYYPRVVWHRGYYDDCCRWAYRPGY